MTEIGPIFRENTLSRKTGSWRDHELKQKPRYLQESETVSPCKIACPLENDIAYWISLIKEGKIKEAWKRLIEKNPLPAVTGRVCQAFCEKDCNRREFDESISIRDLEKFLGDEALIKDWHPMVSKEAKPFCIAVVGSGPAGLSCAYKLGRKGYQVTIFEQLPVLGGMLRVGIPDFRLPKDILEKEIDNIISLGIRIRKDVAINSELLGYLTVNYDAVFVATGLQKSRRLNIEGEENPSVLYGLDFLKDVNLGNKVNLGKKVIVIGGGNTAIDAARTAKRLGSGVSIFYRRTKAEMPAIQSEVSEAQDEGIAIRELVLPVKIIGSFIEFQKAEPGLIPIKGSNFQEGFDNVIVAAGEEKEEISGVSDSGKIFVAKDTANVPAAINSGRLGAQAIDYYLKNGQRLTPKESNLKMIGFNDINAAYFKKQNKNKFPHLEAKRCFSCGICRECENCFNFCPEPAVKAFDKLSLDTERSRSVKKTGDRIKPYAIDYDYCKGCGICAKECPRGVIVMEEEKELKDESK